MFIFVTMQFTGKLTKITPEILVGEKQTPKVTFVVEEVGEMEDYKRNSMAIDILGEKTSMIKEYKVGDVVKVSINFRYSEYNDRLYNRINARRIESADGSQSSSSSTSVADGGDDLPF
jgi:hypothetical protein